MELNERNSSKLAAGHSSSIPSSSTLPLMERINRILGKKTESSSSSNDKAKESDTETDSDKDSDIDDDISLLECSNNFASLFAEPEGSSHAKKANVANNSGKIVKSSHTASKNQNKQQQELPSSRMDIGKSQNNLLAEISPQHGSLSNKWDFPAVSTRVAMYNKIKKNPQKGKAVADGWEERISKSGSFEIQQEAHASEENRNESIHLSVATSSKNSPGAINKKEKETDKDLKRQAKEITKQAKEDEKRRKLEEKESKRRKQEIEKNTKRAESMTAKADSMDQCLKHVAAVIDTSVLSEGGGNLLQGLEAMGVQCEVKKLPVDSTIGWMRNRVEYTAEENGQITRNSHYEEEDQVLMRIKAAEFAKMIASNGANNVAAHQLAVYTCVANAERLLPNKKITLIVTGMDSYAKCAKAKASLKRKQELMPIISKAEMEDVLLQLEIKYNCCVHFCESSDDLAQMVCSFTKSVAEKPYKKTTGVAFNIYMNNHEKGLPRVTKDGQGLLEVWVRQLQQFKGVGYDTAAAIVQKYPSPLMLVKEYKKCKNESEASLLLQDIEVRRGHGVLSTCRRVGPELSKKIHILMSSNEGGTQVAKS